QIPFIFSSKSGYMYHVCKEKDTTVIETTPTISSIYQPRRKVIGEPLRSDVTSISTPNFDDLMDEFIVEWVINRHMYSAIKWTYFNPTNIANFSVVAKSSKHDTVYVFQNNQWIVEKYSDAFDKMFKATHTYLSTYYFNKLMNRETLNQLDITECDDNISTLLKIEREYDYEYMPLDQFNTFSQKELKRLKNRVRSELMFAPINPRYVSEAPAPPAESVSNSSP
ncbi:MAG: hypothetical protein ACO259_09390, partial [Bacteroidia bacterium]